MASDLKKRARKILNAARRHPQYIFRDGQLFLLAAIEPSTGVNPPDVFFADA